MNLRLICSPFAGLATLLFAGCQSNLSSTAPAVTTSFMRAGVREKGDVLTLNRGRTVFLNRCILCHALPDTKRFDAPRLTAIVAKMSGRANLSPEQHDALLQYLLTVRASL